ncbi:MAG: 16S rRNA (guanine(527)-N(7))-methyltransferase RsmG [Bacteroidota bacterium]
MNRIEKYFADFTPKQKEQLEALLPLYKEWNEKINVISRKDIDNFYLHHVLHSLSIATHFEFEKGSTIMDLGCGGGFPGIPLAIFFPDTHFHMADSINKKLNVVKEISNAIGLQNITVQHTRAEEIKNRKFDTVISRAVAPLKDLWRWSKPLIKKVKSDNENVPNGLVCLKGGDLTLEIQESGCKPYIWDIEKIFPEDYFKEKFLIYQPV